MVDYNELVWIYDKDREYACPAEAV